MNPELAARRTAAAAVLADYQAVVDSAPLSKPPGPEWTLRLALALGGLLAASGELAEAQDANARTVGEVRAVLAAFDWEVDDRQYALEAIERIVLTDDEPEPEDYDPGPEADDEGGMSEYRYILPEDYERGQS